MTGNFMGMNPTESEKAIQIIKTFTDNLKNESKSASSQFRNDVNNAFAGSQTSAMNGYISRIETALNELYKFLDGNDDSFTVLYEKAKQSYSESDTNVAKKYNE